MNQFPEPRDSIEQLFEDQAPETAEQLSQLRAAFIRNLMLDQDMPLSVAMADGDKCLLTDYHVVFGVFSTEPEALVGTVVSRQKSYATVIPWDSITNLVYLEK